MRLDSSQEFDVFSATCQSWLDEENWCGTKKQKKTERKHVWESVEQNVCWGASGTMHVEEMVKIFFLRLLLPFSTDMWWCFLLYGTGEGLPGESSQEITPMNWEDGIWRCVSRHRHSQPSDQWCTVLGINCSFSVSGCCGSFLLRRKPYLQLCTYCCLFNCVHTEPVWCCATWPGSSGTSCS